MNDSERSAISGGTAAWIVAAVTLVAATTGWAGFERVQRHQVERELRVAMTTIQVMKEWVVSLNKAADSEAGEVERLRDLLAHPGAPVMARRGEAWTLWALPGDERVEMPAFKPRGGPASWARGVERTAP